MNKLKPKATLSNHPASEADEYEGLIEGKLHGSLRPSVLARLKTLLRPTQA